MHHSQTMRALTPCISEADDADRHAHNLTNWQQEYDQLSGGRFHGRIDEIAVDQIQIFREYTNQALRQQCQVWPDALWLGIPVNPVEIAAKGCKINGQALTANQVMLRPGACDFELITPTDFGIFGLVIPLRVLAGVAHADISRYAERSLQHPTVIINSDTLAQIRILLNQLLLPMHSATEWQDQWQNQLINALWQLIDSEHPPARQKTSYARRRAVVDRVKQWLTAEPQSNPTITELCELTHVSRRTLQYSFDSIVGLSPHEFIRTTRLNQVRRVLSSDNADSQQRSIAAIAADSGFWHPGQFAKEYKTLFGENPSATRRNASP